MTIYEHVQGTISVPVYNENGDYSGNTTDLDFDDTDIIKDSCSITCRACDDTTFSLGGVRPAELSIKLKLEGDGINAYNLYGAKIILYSCYTEDAEKPADDDWVFRGMFWVTSVSRTKTMYTLRASDALVWLSNDSISNAASNNGDSVKAGGDESVISAKLRDMLEGQENSGGGGYYSLEIISNKIVSWANDILQNMIGERPLIYKHMNVPANCPNASPEGYAGYTLMRKSEGGESKNTNYSPSDYIMYLAQVSCGFACVMPELADESTLYAPFSIIPFGYYANEQKIEVPLSAIAMDGSDVASYCIYIQCVYLKTYDGTGWSNSRAYKPMLGNITIDLSGNPFIDGRRMETVINNDPDLEYDGNFPDTAEYNEFQVVNPVANHLYNSILLRPFQTKCYLQFQKTSYPKLGQRIKIEQADGDWLESTITKMIWKFRGGWEFACTGKDSRVLAQAAKRSTSSHAESAAKRHADIAAGEANKAAEAANKAAEIANSHASTANDNANGRLSHIVFNSFMSAVTKSFESANIEFNFEYTDGSTYL